jgi:hypothetical protein
MLSADVEPEQRRSSMSPPHHPAGRLRRRSQGEPLKKATYQLRASVVEAIRAAVEAGEAPSANALGERAVEEHLRERRRARVYAAYAEAAGDPAFVEGMESTDRAFDTATGDGLR